MLLVSIHMYVFISKMINLCLFLVGNLVISCNFFSFFFSSYDCSFIWCLDIGECATWVWFIAMFCLFRFMTKHRPYEHKKNTKSALLFSIISLWELIKMVKWLPIKLGFIIEVDEEFEDFFVVKCLKKYGQEIDNIRCFKKKVL